MPTLRLGEWRIGVERAHHTLTQSVTAALAPRYYTFGSVLIECVMPVRFREPHEFELKRVEEPLSLRS